MKKFLHFDWLRAVQFLANAAPKKEIQCQKRKFSANFFRFKILKFSYDSCIFIASVGLHSYIQLSARPLKF